MWREFLRNFIPRFVAIDPFGVVPIFIGITVNLDEKHRRSIALESVGAAFVIAIGFIFLGQALFNFLGISVTDFQIAGGILLLVLAVLDLLIRGKPAVDATGAVGIVPLAMPLIAGPATLTTSLMLSRSYGPAPVVLGLAVNFVLLMGLLRASSWLTRLLGASALNAMSKLVMLLLAAIAVNFIRQGTTQVVLDIAARLHTGH
jgi:multiple antibiotic resistance protein